MIRTSLQAVPRRSWFLGAKALVFTVVALIAGEILSFVTYFLVQALLKSGPARTPPSGSPTYCAR